MSRCSIFFHLGHGYGVTEMLLCSHELGCELAQDPNQSRLEESYVSDFQSQHLRFVASWAVVLEQLLNMSRYVEDDLDHED